MSYVDTKNQWWRLTKYIYSSTVLKYKFEILGFEYFHFILLYSSTTIQLLHCIHVIPLVNYTKYNQQINYYMLLWMKITLY